MKICTKCGSEGDFPPDSRKRDGLSSWCVPCTRDAKKKSEQSRDPASKRLSAKKHREKRKASGLPKFIVTEEHIKMASTLKSALKNSGKNQRDVANYLGVSDSYVSQLINGRIPISAEQYEKITTLITE